MFFLYFRKNKSGVNLSWILGICFIRVSKLSLYSLNTLYNVLKVSSFRKFPILGYPLLDGRQQAPV